LADAGLSADRGVVYATGRIVLVVPKDATLSLDPQLDGLKTTLASAPDSLSKFAIANPELAPYGKAAVQALQKQAIWPLLQTRLVMGENIAQTTQYISSGAAPAGISALALVLAPAVADKVRYVVVASALHAPIRQRMVLLKTASPTARAFYAFLQSPAARQVLQRYGYE
jgi:molybdate transport system substrate-binding protein